MEIVFSVVENASNVENGNSSFRVILMLRVATSVELQKQEIVIKGFETLIRVLFAFGTVFANELEEFEVAVDGEVFALNDSLLASL